ncbi:MAG: outer membrane beta-barrel protein, partial [Luteimonas sp.]
FRAVREDRDYDDLSRTDRDSLASLGLVNQFSRHWIGRIDLQHRKRDSSAPGQDYDENAAVVSFSYRR